MSSFQNKISNDIDERLRALSQIERAIFTKRYKLNKIHFEYLSVQTITMIYSIWEGFVHTAFQAYIDHLNSLGIPFDKFSDDITVFHMENKFKQLKEYPNRHNGKVAFYQKLQQFYDNKNQIVHNVVNTQSNVSFHILNAILKSFSLVPFPEYWGTYVYPNPSLKDSMLTFLRYRNGIAHGGDVSSEEKVTQLVYSKYKKLVLDLMYETLQKMINGEASKSYER